MVELLEIRIRESNNLIQLQPSKLPTGSFSHVFRPWEIVTTGRFYFKEKDPVVNYKDCILEYSHHSRTLTAITLESSKKNYPSKSSFEESENLSLESSKSGNVLFLSTVTFELKF